MPGTSFARSAPIAVSGVALALASSCRSPSEPRDPDPRYEHIRPEYRSPEIAPSREWLRASFGWLARDTDSLDPVGDGIALGIEGGFDLALTRITPSIEMGLSYTSAHVDVGDAPDVDLLRVNAGLRWTHYAGGWRPHIRGGGFVRGSTDELDEPFDPYAAGVYAGLGIDWPYSGMWLGPSLTYWRAIDEDAPGGDVEEWTFALSATFRL